MQTLFIRGPSATARMVVLVIASITLMTVDHRWRSLEFARSALSNLIYPLQYTIDLPIQLFYWADESFSTQQALLEKNREFEARHLENRVQLQKLDIIEKENERLRKLLSAIPKTTERLLISEIINVDVDPYRQLIILNKGSSNEVYQGQPIIDAQGIMGQIVHVGPLSSTAMLITDASHAIPVQVNRTGLRAIAFGSGKTDQLNLRHLPHSVDIKAGDLLITSGLGGTFPPNFPVAIISKVERPAGEPFALIEAKPHAQLEKSREVLLVWRNKAEETSEKNDAAANDETDSEKIDSNQENDSGNNSGTEKKVKPNQRRGNRE
ncbi:MAG: rod shape-determining protein MreC [Proteobacteria bacterium]|nr:rod shape-determining protein MreC [Pseudomonadota bacterium]